MKSRLDRMDHLAISLNGVADLGLEEKDRFVLNRFPSLVIIEVILQRDLNDLVELITDRGPVRKRNGSKDAVPQN